MHKIILTVAIATSALAAQAEEAATKYGDRYVVKYRNATTFKNLDRQFKTSLNKFSTDLYGRRMATPVVLPGSEAVIEKPLAALNMMIVKGKSAEALRLNPDVEYVEREILFPAPQPLHERSRNTYARRYLREDELTWGLKAINAPQAWEAKPSSAPGDAVKVLILDTGIDRDHPELIARHVEGKNFVSRRTVIDSGPAPENILLASVRRLLNEDEGLTTDEPYDYFDQMGHGTHVAGTIAAEMDGSGVVGVAPASKLYAGRVCGKFGCSHTAILDGVNWAMEVDADVINMSLGGPLSSSAQAEALAAAKAKGVISVAASGNSGTPSVSFPAAFDSVIAVGAIDSNFKKAAFSQWGPELDIMAPGVDINSSIPLGTGRASKVKVEMNGELTEVPSLSFVGSASPAEPLIGELVLAGLGKPEDFPASARGKIALIQRGEIFFADKVKNAVAAGVTGVVIYNNEPGMTSGAITQDGSTVEVPVTMIEQGLGETLKQTLAGGTAVKSSIEIVASNYASFQGTSMASPHAAGVVALLRWAKPDITADQVLTVLRESARKAEDAPENMGENQYGAGIIDAQKAVEKALAL